MNAIVVVFMPARDAYPLTEQRAALPVVDLWRQGTESNTRSVLRQTSDRAQPALPLWTWFIENPRRGGA